ncbi:MAG: hypothetical protein K2N60_07575 [Oscillospiraceae bacterium]|nr:hypothetical protein [Oscillospiraceae bacterium]
MAKKGTKIALTYFITIIVTLIIIGGICFMLFRQLTAPKEPDVTVPDISGLTSNEYVPDAENNKTALFIFDSEKRMSGCCFMLVRLIADERKMAIMPLPADTGAYVGGTEDSLYEFYRKGGAPQAVLAAENAVGVSIAKNI